MGKSRHYCGTLYDEKIKLEDIECAYLVYQNEICPESGRSHRQFYVEFKNPRSLRAVSKLFGKAHVESRRGSREAARDYCMKEASRCPGTLPVEVGEWKMEKKGVSDQWKEIKDLIASGGKAEDVYGAYTGLYVRYKRNIDSIIAAENSRKILAKTKLKYNEAVLSPWQDEVVWELTGQSNRGVLWVYDVVGGQGKTFLSGYIEVMLNGFVTGDGKSSDIAHAYNCEEYVVFDYSRSREESVSYNLIEQLKNGRVFSGKYESHNKRVLSGFCRVVVFANFEPIRSKLSADRWNVYEVLNGILVYRPYSTRVNPNYNIIE